MVLRKGTENKAGGSVVLGYRALSHFRCCVQFLLPEHRKEIAELGKDDKADQRHRTASV